MRPVSGRVEVLTFKQGLLSKVAHDLLLQVERFEVLTDGTRVEARFELGSLGVEGVMRDGVFDPHGLSEGDRRDIVGNIQNKIVHTKEHPTARLVARAERTGSGFRLKGDLSLAGQTRDIEIDVRAEAGRWRGQVELVPTRWGIEPFKALLGAIKLQDRVVVRFDLEAFEP